jgi:uncharacterized protein YggT (Ycf19 family)
MTLLGLNLPDNPNGRTGFGNNLRYVLGVMDAFGLINFVLAAAMYTLLGRFLLSLVFDDDNPMVLWRVFRQVTNPILAAVRQVTPAIVPLRVIILFAVMWCLALRMAVFVLFRMYGLTAEVPL